MCNLRLHSQYNATSGCLLVFIEYLTPASTTSRPTHNYYNTDTYEGSYLKRGSEQGSRGSNTAVASLSAVGTSFAAHHCRRREPRLLQHIRPHCCAQCIPASSSSCFGARVPSTTTSPPKQQNNAGTFAAANAYYMDRGESSKARGPTRKAPSCDRSWTAGPRPDKPTCRQSGGVAQTCPTTVIRAPLAGADGETAIWASFITSTVSHYSLPISDPVFHPIGWSFIIGPHHIIIINSFSSRIMSSLVLNYENTSTPSLVSIQMGILRPRCWLLILLFNSPLSWSVNIISNWYSLPFHSDFGLNCILISYLPILYIRVFSQ